MRIAGHGKRRVIKRGLKGSMKGVSLKREEFERGLREA